MKRLFRFAAEGAEREDHETEHMCVLISDLDDDGNYVGTVENDPHHCENLRYGDTISFHRLHVISVLEEDAQPPGGKLTWDWPSLKRNHYGERHGKTPSTLSVHHSA
ncbi:MAG: DUF2314 domain-containing protein [Planctomycetota bacterium]